jgi:hypothetical protein
VAQRSYGYELSLQSQRRAAAVEKQHGVRAIESSNELKFPGFAFLAASAEPAFAGSSIP